MSEARARRTAVAMGMAGLVVVLMIQALPGPATSAEPTLPNTDRMAETRLLADPASTDEECHVPPPSDEPTPFPSDEPTPFPSDEPTPLPSDEPTPSPTPTPSLEPTPQPTWGPPPGPRLGSPEIFGYLPNWDLGANIDYGAITTVAYFGLAAGGDGRLVRRTAGGAQTQEYSRWQSQRVTNAISAAHANGVKFVLTVERMAWDVGTRAVTRRLLSNPTARTTLVSEIVAEVQARGIDGVSLDFEPILSDQRDNFAYLLGELRAALYAANPEYQLTFAATGSQPALTYQMIGNVTASGAADAVIIMGYPLRGLGANYAGGLAPVFSPTSYDLEQITNAYLNRVSADKVVMALPWYGRQWPTVSDEVNARVQEDRNLYDRPRNIGYTGALAIAAQYGRNADPVEVSAWTAYRWRFKPQCPETWKQVYYDDVETLGFKYDWVMSRGLAGIGIWALGYDNGNPEMWKLLRVKYRGLVDVEPPVGSIAVAPGERVCGDPRIKLALTADDGPDGSGTVYVRLSNASDVGADGVLVQGRTYPAVGEVEWPLDDPTLGASPTSDDRTVYAQWRDVAGNWSGLRSLGATPATGPQVDFTVAGGQPLVNTGTVSVQAAATGGTAIASALVSSSPDVIDGVLANAVTIPVDEPTPFSLTDPATGGLDTDGEHVVYGQWQDTAGCWSEPVARTIVLDREAPSGTLSIVDNVLLSATGTVQLDLTSADVGAGVVLVELSNDATTWTAVAPVEGRIAWSAAGVVDGTWTISARWTDGAGNISDPASASLLLDRAGPDFTILPVVVPVVGDQLGTSTVPTTVSWRAVDAVSGLAGALLETRRNTGPWRSVAGVDDAGDSTLVTLARSATWRLRVLTTDAAGNASAYASLGPIAVKVPQEGARKLKYTGKWTTVRNGAAAGGRYRYSTGKGATATLTFTGRAIAWVAPVAANLGNAQVYVDGQLVATVDLKSSTSQARRILFSSGWASAGAHTIRIKVLGTAARPRVNLDCFIVLT